MPILNFSPEFNLEYYRRTYPELNNFIDDVIKEHYKNFAVEQGRSTCPYDRRDSLHKFLQGAIDKQHLRTLEIGCGGYPFLRGETVKYFETMSTEALKQHYIDVGYPIEGFIEKFDFVSATGDLGIVNETFDIVFTSHVIEHCPDLVEHFQNVSRLLNRGGLYVLIVPDKRYCFDHYNPESTIAEVIDAFANEHKTARLADVIHHTYTRTHNNPVLHWLGEHGKRYGYRDTPLEPDANIKIRGETFADDGKGLNREQILRLIEKYAETLDSGEYISAHNWRFTPESFGYIVNLLNALEFIDLKLYRLCHTLWGRLEFIALLEKI